MRPRHWKQVLRHATAPFALMGRGGTFDPTLLEDLTFGQLLEMNLHCEFIKPGANFVWPTGGIEFSSMPLSNNFSQL